MARRVALNEVEAGHYYARVAGARYEMRAVPGRTRTLVLWDLYRVVDGDEEFLDQAPTLKTHRRTLEALVGELGDTPPRRMTPPVPRDVMQWTDLAEDLALAAEQARQIELPTVQRALAIAQSAAARQRGTVAVVVATPPMSEAEGLTDQGDALDVEAERLHDLAVSLEIARDQARRVGADRGTIGCALGVAIRGVDARADQIMDAQIRLEAVEDTRVTRGSIEAGHYYANVAGARYEVTRRTVQRAPRETAWDLYRVVQNERELVHQAETLSEHRETLAVIRALLSEPSVQRLAGASPSAPRPPERERPEDPDHASEPNTNVVDLVPLLRRRREGGEQSTILTGDLS